MAAGGEIRSLVAALAESKSSDLDDSGQFQSAPLSGRSVGLLENESRQDGVKGSWRLGSELNLAQSGTSPRWKKRPKKFGDFLGKI